MSLRARAEPRASVMMRYRGSSVFHLEHRSGRARGASLHCPHKACIPRTIAGLARSWDPNHGLTRRPATLRRIRLNGNNRRQYSDGARAQLFGWPTRVRTTDGVQMVPPNRVAGRRILQHEQPGRPQDPSTSFVPSEWRRWRSAHGEVFPNTPSVSST